MAVFDYSHEVFSKVSVCGIECGFSDVRIDRDSVPDGMHLYEVADDDESCGDPARIKKGIMVNFCGTLVCKRPLPLWDDGVLWLKDGDFRWL